MQLLPDDYRGAGCSCGILFPSQQCPATPYTRPCYPCNYVWCTTMPNRTATTMPQNSPIHAKSNVTMCYPMLQISSCKRVCAMQNVCVSLCCGNRGQGCTNKKHCTSLPQTVHVTTFSPTCPTVMVPLQQGFLLLRRH
jgi:hypothetical protein